MTVFQLRVTLEDAYSRQTTRSYETEDISGADKGAEFLTARGYAATLITAIEGLSDANVLSWTLGERVVNADSVSGNANVDEGLTLVLRKTDNYKGVLKIPAPVMTVFNPDETADITDPLITAFTDHFVAGNGFTFSDGENQTALVKGRLDK